MAVGLRETGIGCGKQTPECSLEPPVACQAATHGRGLRDNRQFESSRNFGTRKGPLRHRDEGAAKAARLPDDEHVGKRSRAIVATVDLGVRRTFGDRPMSAAEETRQLARRPEAVPGADGVHIQRDIAAVDQ